MEVKCKRAQSDHILKKRLMPSVLLGTVLMMDVSLSVVVVVCQSTYVTYLRIIAYNFRYFPEKKRGKSQTKFINIATTATV